jgi:hypothetical protein
MTDRDVLIERVFTLDGKPAVEPALGGDDVSEDTWRVSAPGKPTVTLHPFQDALDAALEWVHQTGGEIYLLDTLGGTPELYKPTA